MKKNFTVNISGKIFHIDEDAYVMLEKFFNFIENSFSGLKNSDELLDEIKFAIATSFSSGHFGQENTVVSLEHVRHVLLKFNWSESNPNMSDNTKQRKHFLREADRRALGGVASGFSVFTGIPVWLLRLILVLLSAVYGLGILIYLVFWIIVPQANTPLKKLQMNGLSFSVSSIRDISEKNTNKIQNRSKNILLQYTGFIDYSSLQRFYQKNMAFLNLQLIVRIIFGTLLLSASLFGIVGTVVFLFLHPQIPVFINGVETITQLSKMLSGYSFVGWIILVCFAIVLLIPLLSLLAYSFKILNNGRFIVLKGRWLLRYFFTANVFIIVIAAGFLYIQFLFAGQREKKYIYPSQHHSVITLTFRPDKAKEKLFTDNIKWLNFKSKYIIGKPDFEIRHSGNDSIYIVVQKKSYGRTSYNAEKNCNLINYEVNSSRDTIRLAPYFESQTQRWYAQNVRVILFVPEGKRIRGSEGFFIRFFHENVANVPKSKNRIYMMTDAGLIRI